MPNFTNKTVDLFSTLHAHRKTVAGFRCLHATQTIAKLTRVALIFSTPSGDVAIIQGQPLSRAASDHGNMVVKFVLIRKSGE